ncbi:MAG: ABC transporter permease [Ilumatobacteraceae bacterium]|nr:ABC transporter permease [Ilumatobacteraceae bacterium]
MRRAVVRRLLALIPLLLVVSFIVFSLLLLTPGDPAITLAGDNPTPEQIAEIRSQLGLDDPIIVQYGRWVSDAVRGDLGTSLYSSASVTDAIWSRLPVTLSLTGAAIIFSVMVAVPLGLLAARRPGGVIDHASTGVATIGIALPSFWIGMVLIIVFALRLGWFPPVGYVSFGDDPLEWARHMVLPAIALGTAGAAETTRQLRGAMLDVLDSDYVRTARSKGMRGGTVLYKHALKNAGSPVLTVLGLQVTFLLGGSVIIEQMFAIPGLGSLAITAVLARDIPMIQGVVLVAVVVSVGINLLVDLAYAWLNPKVRA